LLWTIFRHVCLAGWFRSILMNSISRPVMFILLTKISVVISYKFALKTLKSKYKTQKKRNKWETQTPF
jgi:hypothetical protein